MAEADSAASSSFELEPGRPRELLPVANRPLIEHGIAACAAAGAGEVLIAAPDPLLGQLRTALSDDARPGVHVEFLAHRGAGMASAVASAAEHLAGDGVLVQRAEGLTGPGLAAAGRVVAAGEADAVLLVDPGATGAASIETRRLLRLVLGPHDGARRTGLAGACALGAAAVRAAAERSSRGERLELSDFLDPLAAGGGRVIAAAAEGWHRYAGHAEDLLELNRIALETLGSAEAPNAVRGGSRLHGRVEIHPTAEVDCSVIRGPAIVGPRARIRDAYIGPYTSLGADVHVEGAEIEHSILLPGARILHVDRRIEGSIIGRDAKVFRDFSLPRALRLHIGDRVEVCLC